MDNVLLEIQSVPGNPRRLVLTLTESRFDVSGRSLSWHEIDQIRYGAVDSHVNGAYTGTTLNLAVASGDRRVQFLLASGTRVPLRTKVDQQRRLRNRHEWEKAVAILDERVGNRLVTEAVTTVRAGGATTFAGLRLDPQGVHKPGLFRKSVRWDEVAGTGVKSLEFQILARAGDRTKPAIKIHRDGWNVVLLPRVVGILAPGAG